MADVSPEFQLRLLVRSDENTALVQGLFARAPRYFEAVQGAPANANEAEDEFDLRPPDTSAGQMHHLGIFAGDELAGFAVVVNGYPTETHAYVGLLLFPEDRQRQGLGTCAWQKMEALIRSWPAVQTIRLGVANSADVSGFWKKMGFHPTGRLLPCHQSHVKARIIELEKDL